MRTSKYSEEQIIRFLKQVEAGVPVKDVCRKGGFSDCGRRLEFVFFPPV